MGNHCIDCDYCGLDLRSGGHASDCPIPAYEEERNKWWERRKEFVRDFIRSHEKLAEETFDAANPMPQEPKRVPKCCANRTECPSCGRCPKCSSHTRECPVPAYTVELSQWEERRAGYVKASTVTERTNLDAREFTATLDFDRLNPPPAAPKRLRG